MKPPGALVVLRNHSMQNLGFQLIHGDYLSRSVRGIPCAPP